MKGVERQYLMEESKSSKQGTFERRGSDETIYVYLPNIRNEAEKRDINEPWAATVYGLILVELHEMSHWAEGPLTKGKEHNVPWNRYLNHKVIKEVHNFSES